MAKRLYKVTSGDSLSKIAVNLLGDKERWQEIAYINSLSSPYVIFPGQILLIPDDSSELEIMVTKGQAPPSQGAPQAPGTREAPAPTAPPAWQGIAWLAAAGLALLAFTR